MLCFLFPAPISSGISNRKINIKYFDLDHRIISSRLRVTNSDTHRIFLEYISELCVAYMSVVRALQ
jgi:hypothetical protein